ncbi:hypothetical protein ABBQ38_002848 [Trebouxia sp. C0009 RCD-2024]
MSRAAFKRLGQSMAMLNHRDESIAALLARVKLCMEQLYIQKFAAQTSCVAYLRRQWASDVKLKQWVRGCRTASHSQQDTAGTCEGFHSALKGCGLADRWHFSNRRLDWLLHVLTEKFEIRASQQSKVSGFTRNRKKEQLLTNAVIVADKIADGQVTLPVQPGQPAHVTSQNDHCIRYRVTEACTDAGSCSCPQGTLGYMCKHRVKAIGLLLDCSKQHVVLFLGTRAGSHRGGMQQLLERCSSNTQPEPPERDS